MNSRKRIMILAGSVLLLALFACEETVTDGDLSGLSISIAPDLFPAGTVSMALTLSNQAGDERTATVDKQETNQVASFDDLAVGDWQLHIAALDSRGYELYSCDTEFHFDGEHMPVLTLEFTAVYLVLHYFDTPAELNWSGPASMEVIDGELHLQAQGATLWGYEIFDPWSVLGVTSGNLEFDLQIVDQGGYVDMRGHDGQGYLDWGPYIVFRDNHFMARLAEGAVETGLMWEIETWYHLKIEFDNGAGNKGEYSFSVTEAGTDDTLTAGPYDYHASTGRMIDLVQYSFGARPGEADSATIIIDNLLLFGN